MHTESSKKFPDLRDWFRWDDTDKLYYRFSAKAI